MSPLAKQYEHQFRSVLSQFATGVAVVTAVNKGVPVGLTIQSFCSLSLDPPLILLCPGITSTSWPKIAEVGYLCVNLLAEGQEQIARQFARSGGDKYGGVAWTAATHSGSPILDGALPSTHCSADNHYPARRHP